jgi:predicted phosphoribosyltransferase
MNPKRLIIALPISPKGTTNKLKNENIDHIEVITSPQKRNFRSIEQYYQHFDQITDKQVRYHTKKFRVITNFEQGLIRCSQRRQ